MPDTGEDQRQLVFRFSCPRQEKRSELNPDVSIVASCLLPPHLVSTKSLFISNQTLTIAKSVYKIPAAQGGLGGGGLKAPNVGTVYWLHLLIKV